MCGLNSTYIYDLYINFVGYKWHLLLIGNCRHLITNLTVWKSIRTEIQLGNTSLIFIIYKTFVIFSGNWSFKYTIVFSQSSKDIYIRANEHLNTSSCERMRKCTYAGYNVQLHRQQLAVIINKYDFTVRTMPVFNVFVYSNWVEYPSN